MAGKRDGVPGVMRRFVRDLREPHGEQKKETEKTGNQRRGQPRGRNRSRFSGRKRKQTRHITLRVSCGTAPLSRGSSSGWRPARGDGRSPGSRLAVPVPAFPVSQWPGPTGPCETGTHRPQLRGQPRHSPTCVGRTVFPFHLPRGRTIEATLNQDDRPGQSNAYACFPGPGRRFLVS